MIDQRVKKAIDQMVEELDRETIEAAPSWLKTMHLVGGSSKYLKAISAKGYKIGVPVRWAQPDEEGRDGYYLFDRECGVSWPISERYDIDAVWNQGMSCTAEAVFRILDRLKILHSHICIIGRGHAVKGLAGRLLDNDATVTICHSKTKNLTSAAFFSEIIINASPADVATFSACVDSVIIDISGSLSRWRDSNLATYIGPGDVGRLNVSILLNRLATREE